MEGRQLLQYIIDISDVSSAERQEATEYLAKLIVSGPRPSPAPGDGFTETQLRQIKSIVIDATTHGF
jgi:hypothetical protein